MFVCRVLFMVRVIETSDFIVGLQVVEALFLPGPVFSCRARRFLQVRRQPLVIGRVFYILFLEVAQRVADGRDRA